MSNKLLIRKLIGHALLYISSILVFYFFISASLYFYRDDLQYFENMTLPVIYGSISFAVLLVSQLFLIGRRKGYELKISSYAMMFFFGVYFILLSVILAIELASTLPTGENIWYFLAFDLSLYALFIVEVVLGLFGYLKYRKLNPKPKKKTDPYDERVNVRKE